MNTVEEITALENQLREAELGPDPAFFEKALADDMVIIANGEPAFAKKKIVAAHQPGAGPKFTTVAMSNLKIIDHGVAAVVTCDGTFEGPQGKNQLKFMRVWAKKNGTWQIITGTVTHTNPE